MTSPSDRTPAMPTASYDGEARQETPYDGTPYARMGGAPAFAQLTAEFYKGVAADPELRPMYPEADLRPAEERLRMFLEQYWGGPTTYGDLRGHPRLRMRHVPFAVTPAARDRWLHHMMAAVDTLDMPAAEESMLRDYLTRAAHSLVNRMD